MSEMSACNQQGMTKEMTKSDITKHRIFVDYSEAINENLLWVGENRTLHDLGIHPKDTLLPLRQSGG